MILYHNIIMIMLRYFVLVYHTNISISNFQEIYELYWNELDS